MPFVPSDPSSSSGLGEPFEMDALVADEQRLSRAVADAIAAAARRQHKRTSDLKDFLSLRQDASEAKGVDLAALVTEMHAIKSRAAMQRTWPLPDVRTPYFAHMRLVVDGKARDVLLGYVTFIEPEHKVTIIDWRHAPIARVFFNYRQGEEYEEELSGRVVFGQVEVRRILTFQDGGLFEITSPEGTFRKDGEGRWAKTEARHLPRLAGAQGGPLARQIVGTGETGRKLPSVSALLDKEQYAVLNADDGLPLLVVGGAGCGKTTVAVHRLALLSYRDPNRYPIDKIVMVVPERGLIRLTRALLAELNMEGVAVRTFDDWVELQARRVFRNLPRRICADTPLAVTAFKRHPAFRAILPVYVERMASEISSRLKKKLFQMDGVEEVFRETEGSNLLSRLKETRRRLIGSCSSDLRPQIDRVFKDEIGRLFGFREDWSALMGDRSVLEEVAARSSGQLSQSMVAAVLSHHRRQMAEPSEKRFAYVDPERRTAVDGLGLDEDTPEEVAGTIDVEDFAVLLELHKLRTGFSSEGPFRRMKKHRVMVVDEAQDLASIELGTLASALTGESSLTVAGDPVQQIDPSIRFVSWEQSMQDLGAEEHAMVLLKRTYRCTRPIIEFAYDLLGPLAPVTRLDAPRPGVPVARSVFPNEGLAGIFLSEALSDLQSREPQANVAVITRTAQESRRVHDLLVQSVPARLVHDGEFTLRPGIDVADVSQVKGLEFDYVIVPDASASAYPATSEARRALHVAATRAIEQLWVISVGQPSPILPAELPQEGP